MGTSPTTRTGSPISTTHLYKHSDPRQGFHPEWKSHIFNLGRNEVRSFLLSSGLFWLNQYHADGLRLDGVASMLCLDYARQLCRRAAIACEWLATIGDPQQETKAPRS